MIVGVPKESYPGEQRVALVPAVVPTLAKAGHEVVVQSEAGAEAGYPDALYLDKGTTVDTNTYFGRLPASYFQRWTSVTEVQLRLVLDTSTSAQLALRGSDSQGNARTIAHTVRGFDDMASLGAQVTIFRLGNDPGLARFIDQVARRVQGRVVVPDLDGLGAAVVGDYLRSRRR